MRLDAMDVRFDPRDLNLQRLDPLVELFDRNWIKILAAKRDQRVVRLAWKEILEVHGWKFGPGRERVNRLS